MRLKSISGSSQSVLRLLSSSGRKNQQLGFRSKSTVVGKGDNIRDNEGQPVFTDSEFKCVKRIVSGSEEAMQASLNNIADEGKKIGERLAIVETRIPYLQEGINSVNKRLDEFKGDVGKRFDVVDDQFKEFKKDVDKRFDGLNNNLKWSVGILIASMVLIANWVDKKDQIKAVFLDDKAPSIGHSQ